MHSELKYCCHLLYFPFAYLMNRVKVLLDCFRRVPFDEKKILILTHDLGGGTAKYIDSIKNGDTIIIKNIEYIWHIGYKVEYDNQITYITDSQMKRIINSHYEMVVINSLVKMTQIDELISLLVQNKKKHDTTKYIYLVHDYHAICPNFNLVYNKKYCGLVCEKCNNTKPIVYGSKKRIEISEWRAMWKGLFDVCEEIRCFSNSSKDIINVVYPEFINKITVIPHTIEELPGMCDIQNTNIPVVGFFGIINNTAKGLYQTRDLIAEINSQISIVFVGSKEEEIGVKKSNITYMGRYDRYNLIDIINKRHINIAIFPSIAPETFSFLVSELMQSGIKILSFDIGAQGEKVKKYNNGKVFDTCQQMSDYVNSYYALHREEESVD